MMMTNQKNHQTKPNTSNQMKPNTSNLIAALNKFQASNTKAERDGVNPYKEMVLIHTLNLIMLHSMK